MNGAQLILKVLARHNINCVFGYPGGAIMPIYDALYRSEVKHYLCRQEQGAAFAALGYAKASGRVGVCMATSGPGMTNLVTGLADATADSVAVLAITGQVPTALMGTDAFQEVDVLGVSLGVTKHAFQVTDVEQLESILERALQIATTGRPGAVLVDIPKDVQMAEASFKPLLMKETLAQEPSIELIEQANQLIKCSRKPILYIGGGVAIGGATEQLRNYQQRSGIPSVATLKGLGCSSLHAACYLGMLGMHGNKAANLAVQDCDLLIALGARFDDRVTGKLAEFAPHARVIHIDIDQAELGKLRHPCVAIKADLGKVLMHLSSPRKIDQWQAQCRNLIQKNQYSYTQHVHAKSINAPTLLNQLSHMLPKNNVVTTDVGQHQMWVAQHMQFKHPNNFLTSGALGTMGFGLPAAIGAQLARPNAKVIAVTGDGSIMMNIQELGTIKRFNLAVKILLIDNTKLGMVRQWQSLFFDKRFSETDLSDNPDFIQLAASFGIQGKTISKSSEIAVGLELMLHSKQAFLLHVRIDPDQNVWPLVPPNSANQSMLEG
ncbi:acetolactate synthase 2 catalytic subunit [Aliikangiella sp. IMCC44632]